MPNGVQFSIIVIARRINDYIRAALPHLNDQDYPPCEILIVSEAQETECFPNTRIITSGRASPAKARNIGAREAKGDILAFIDDDAYPSRNWLETARRDFEDETLGAVGGPSLVPPGATFFQKVSNKVFELSSGKTGHRYGRGRKREIDDWPTCNFFVRKVLFDRAGGFDEQYWGGEDTRFCYALIRCGAKLLYDPDLIVYHHPRKTLGQHMRQTYFWGLWRGFMIKHLPQSRQVVFILPSLWVSWLVFGGIAACFLPLFRAAFCISLLVYGISLIILSFRSKRLAMALAVAGVMSLSHIAYGVGFLRGLTSRGAPTRKTLNPETHS